MESQEEWRDIPGFEGIYQASSAGRIRSLTRTIRAVSRWGTEQVYEREGQVLKPKRDKDGYLCLRLRAGPVQHFVRVNRLVCEAFHGSPPAGHVAAHNDGSRDNNTPANLRWDTHKGNHADRVDHGTAPRGAAHGRAKVTPEIAFEIMARLSGGATQKAVAAELNMPRTVVWKIWHRQHWTTRGD